MGSALQQALIAGDAAAEASLGLWLRQHQSQEAWKHELLSWCSEALLKAGLSTQRLQAMEVSRRGAACKLHATLAHTACSCEAAWPAGCSQWRSTVHL